MEISPEEMVAVVVRAYSEGFDTAWKMARQEQPSQQVGAEPKIEFQFTGWREMPQGGNSKT